MPWLHKAKKNTRPEPAQQQQQQHQQQQPLEPPPQSEGSQNIEQALRDVLEALFSDKQGKSQGPGGGDGAAVNLRERIMQSAGINTDAQETAAPMRPLLHHQQQDPDEYSNALKCIQQYLDRAASRSPRQQQQQYGATVSAASVTVMPQTTSTFTSDQLDPPSSASRLRRRKGRPHRRELMPPEADIISGLTSEDVQESEESEGTVKGDAGRSSNLDAKARGHNRRLPPQRLTVQFAAAPIEANIKPQRARPLCTSFQHQPSSQPLAVHTFSCSVVAGCCSGSHNNSTSHVCAATILLLTQPDRPLPPPLRLTNESLAEKIEPEAETVASSGRIDEEERIGDEAIDQAEDKAQGFSENVDQQEGADEGEKKGEEDGKKEAAEEDTESSGTNGNASPAPSAATRTLDTCCGGDTLETNTCTADAAEADATGEDYPDGVVFVGANGNNLAPASYRYLRKWSPPIPPLVSAPFMHGGVVESRLPIERTCEAPTSIEPVVPLHASAPGNSEAAVAEKGHVQFHKVVQWLPEPQLLAQPLALEDGDGRSSPHSITTLEVMDKNRADDGVSNDSSVTDDEICYKDDAGSEGGNFCRHAPVAIAAGNTGAAGDTAAAIPATDTAAPSSSCSCGVSKSSGFTRLLETLDKAHRRRESRRPMSPSQPAEPQLAVCAAAGDPVVAEPSKGVCELAQTQRIGYLGYLNRQRASIQTLDQMLQRSPFVSTSCHQMSPPKSPQPPLAKPEAPKQQEKRQPQRQHQATALRSPTLPVQENRNQQLPAQAEQSQSPVALPNDVIGTTATSLMCLSQSLQRCVIQIEDTVHKLSGGLRE